MGCFLNFLLFCGFLYIGLLPIYGPVHSFTFSDNPRGQVPSPTPVLTRQLITGIVSPNVISPNIVSGSYCQCVPPGTCVNGIPIPTTSTDGSGQLDIRIVNNAVSTIVTTSAPFTCLYGLVACCQLGTYQCGRNWPPPPNSATAATGQASFGEYPWQVAMLTLSDVYIGSGALITAQHVLTAAHKVYNLTVSTFKVRVGEWDASSTNEPIPAQDVLISAVYINPGFNVNNLQNDVAIIRLATAVSLTSRSTVGTVCLPTVALSGIRCWVSGWGKNDFGPTGAYQAIQREVDVPLIPSATCQSALQATRLGSSFILNTTSFLCAGGEQGKDSCTGDGGSPLVCQSNGIWYVVGMVAWGIGCATAGIPGVYVNVASYLTWISTILSTT